MSPTILLLLLLLAGPGLGLQDDNSTVWVSNEPQSPSPPSTSLILCRKDEDPDLQRTARLVAKERWCGEEKYCGWKVNPAEGWLCNNELMTNRSLTCASAVWTHPRRPRDNKDGKMVDEEGDLDDIKADDGKSGEDGEIFLDGKKHDKEKKRKNDKNRKKRNKRRDLVVSVVCRRICVPEVDRMNKQIPVPRTKDGRREEYESRLKNKIRDLEPTDITSNKTLEEGEEIYWVSRRKSEMTEDVCKAFESDVDGIVNTTDGGVCISEPEGERVITACLFAPQSGWMTDCQKILFKIPGRLGKKKCQELQDKAEHPSGLVLRKLRYQSGQLGSIWMYYKMPEPIISSSSARDHCEEFVKKVLNNGEMKIKNSIGCNMYHNGAKKTLFCVSKDMSDSECHR